MARPASTRLQKHSEVMLRSYAAERCITDHCGGLFERFIRATFCSINVRARSDIYRGWMSTVQSQRQLASNFQGGNDSPIFLFEIGHLTYGDAMKINFGDYFEPASVEDASWLEQCAKTKSDTAFAFIPYTYEKCTRIPNEPQRIEGCLSPSQTRGVWDVLRKVSADDETCFCGFWEGYGCWDQGFDKYTQAIAWDYYLFTASLSSVHEYCLLLTKSYIDPWPNVVWPKDRSWFLATPYHGYSTYIGSTIAVVDLVESQSDLRTIDLNGNESIFE